MKLAALTIGSVLLVGGVAGVVNPREWTYATQGGRFGGYSGARTISKDGTRFLGAGGLLLGAGILLYTLKSQAKHSRTK